VQESLLFSLKVSVEVSKVNCIATQASGRQEQRRVLYKEFMIQPPPFNKAVSHALPDWHLRFCVFPTVIRLLVVSFFS